MGKEKYYYNKHTLQYEKHVEPLQKKLLKALGFFSAVLVTAIILSTIFFRLFSTPQEKAVERELAQMEYKYNEVSNKLELMQDALSNLYERDASVHRVVFGMDPIDENIWNGGVGGSSEHFEGTGFKNTASLVLNAEQRIQKLAQQINITSKSLDTIQQLAKDREEMLASLPSIKPVREDKVKRNINTLSGFGRRKDPIHKIMRMHQGIDFPAKVGTPIQATGNGVVAKVAHLRSGYGTHVIIDHGHGYKSLYAHMSKALVKKGDKVVKGQEIGKVGNTGKSTGAHLHYEVIRNGRPINPIDFILDGLSPKEYQELVNAASVTNQSFD